MSCPDWTCLAPAEGVPVAMREHAEACERCRARALRQDPLLIFRRLPALEASASDIEAMKLSVAAMRRGQAVNEGALSAADRWSARGRFSSLRAAAVAAVVLGALVTFWAAREGPGDPPDVAERVAAAPSAETFSERTVNGFEVDVPRPAQTRRPLIESVDGFEVIYMAYDDLDLVVAYPRSGEVLDLDV